MPEEHDRTSRVAARISPNALAIVRRAAELQGRSVSDFMVAAAQAAHRMIDAVQITRLSMADQQAFAQAILAPPEPNAALVRSAAAYRSLVKTSR